MSKSDKAQAQSVIAAVSGGVDSAVMLHHIATKPDSVAVVAHYDHGIREDSADDARFVKGLAEKYGLRFELGEGHLGANASEDRARSARHTFLREVSQKYGGVKIATAHHRDDTIETAIINILRGTGRRGMSALRETDLYLRPLISWTKPRIYEYAVQNRLEWVEDPTNASDKYLRNRVRHKLIPLLRQRGSLGRFAELIGWFYGNNPTLDNLLDRLLASRAEITRDHIALDLHVLGDEVIGKEVVIKILKELEAEVDQAEISRLLHFAKNGREGAIFNQFPPVRITKQTKWLLLESPTASRDQESRLYYR